MVDPATGKPRRARAFVMTLSYSRHRFVRFVFLQDSPTWIDCHMRAFGFYGAVLDPRRKGLSQNPARNRVSDLEL